jgi:hypothetical protein
MHFARRCGALSSLAVLWTLLALAGWLGMAA